MKRECQRRHYASHKEELQRKSREFHRQLRGNNRTFASSENSVVKGVKKFLQASGKAERSQMLIMLYQAKKLSDNQLADSRTYPAHLLVMLTKHSFYVLFLFHTLSIQLNQAKN